MRDSNNHEFNEGDNLAVKIDDLCQVHIEKISHITPLNQPPHVLVEATVKLKWRVLLVAPDGSTISPVLASFPFKTYLIKTAEKPQSVGTGDAPPKSSLIV